MGLKEQFRDLPSVESSVIDQRNEEVNHLFRMFDNGDIDEEELRFTLDEIDHYYDIPELRFKYPGPLYGILRKVLHYSKEQAHKMATEERAHYFIAKKWNADPSIVFQIGHTISNEQKEEELHLRVVYTIPAGLTEEEIKEMNREIALAYQNPSEDDLGKLGY